MLRFFFYLLLLTTMPLMTHELSIYSELGSFSKAYQDPRLKEGYKKDTLSSTTYTIGGYYHGQFSKKTTWGVGIVQTKIQANSIKIENTMIEQPESMITLPYLFIGWNGLYLGFEIGVSYYLNSEKFKARSFLDGTLVEEGGWGLNRTKSHTFPNMKLRVWKKDSVHLEILLGRGNFSPIDSLFRLNLVVPISRLTLNADLSLHMPFNYFSDSDKILKSNERFSLGVAYRIGTFQFGVQAGILISNLVGGSGHIPNQNKLSASIHASMKF